jgi:hypothetical protein
MNKTKITPQPLKQNLQAVLKLKKFAWLIILIFFIVIYGYVLLKINDFHNQQPTQSAVSTYLKTTNQPNFNPTVVKRLETLKNNSVNVRALFNQARHNPFQ